MKILRLENVISEVLAWLWDVIAEPVLENLDIDWILEQPWI